MSTKLMIIYVVYLCIDSFIIFYFYCDYFKQNSELHNYNTRNSSKLYVNFQRTNYRMSLYGMISMKIPKISNRISLLRKK
jgi:hypothetical protein